MKKKVVVARFDDLTDRHPAYAMVSDVDLVVVRHDTEVSVLYGRCLHRGALLSDGHIEGNNIVCGVHGWDYRLDTGVSEYNNDEALHRFQATVEDGQVVVDDDEIKAFARRHPQPYDRKAYLGLYADVHGTPVEPHNRHIQELARDGLSRLGHHGELSAMGVPRQELPTWDDIQILTAQLARKPQLDDAPVKTELVIGPGAQKPLTLDIPLFVSDMSFEVLDPRSRLGRQRFTAVTPGDLTRVPNQTVRSHVMGQSKGIIVEDTAVDKEVSVARSWAGEGVCRGCLGRGAGPSHAVLELDRAERERKGGGSENEVADQVEVPVGLFPVACVIHEGQKGLGDVRKGVHVVRQTGGDACAAALDPKDELLFLTRDVESRPHPHLHCIQSGDGDAHHDVARGAQALVPALSNPFEGFDQGSPREHVPRGDGGFVEERTIIHGQPGLPAEVLAGMSIGFAA